MIRIGLISDTHGLLRPEALAFLHGADRVIHAGDIGSAAILEALNAIAPVTAVRGNNDVDGWHHLSATACAPAARRHARGGLRPLAPARGQRAWWRALRQSRQRRTAPVPTAGFRRRVDRRRNGGHHAPGRAERVPHPLLTAARAV